MLYQKMKAAFVALAIVTALGLVVPAQSGQGGATASQRLTVMSSKIDTMRRSLRSMISVLEKENKDEDEKNLDSPRARLTSLEKEASRLSSEINNLRGKIDRGEKYEAADVDTAEQAVADLQTRVDKAQSETASARATPDSPVGKPREIKKKKKFLGIFGGEGNDEYDELIGNVSPGRDR